MPKYRVYLSQVVSTVVEVEAEDGNAAVDEALDQGLPGLMFLDHTYPDEGGWDAPSTLFPDHNKPEDDYELVGE